MKKVMIGVLILIPLLIMATVAAVSTFVSTRTHIAVDDVNFNSHKTVVLPFGEEYYELSDYLEVVVLPERATDKTVYWSITELECYDADYELRWKNGEAATPAVMVDTNGNEVSDNTTGSIRVVSYCYFYVKVSAETMSDTCLVYVGGSDVEAVKIEGENSFAVGEKAMLSAVFNPVDAIVPVAEWESSNPQVAKVDGNGIVTALTTGTTQITVKAKTYSKDTYVNGLPFTVSVTEGVTNFGSAIKIHSTSVPLADLGITEAVAVEKCSVEDGTLTFDFGEIDATILVNGQTVTLNRVAESAIAIENADLLDVNLSSYVLEANALPLKLSAVWASNLKTGEPSGVRWSSSRPSIASVNSSGKVTGLSGGITVITASCGEGENEVSANLTLSVETKVTNLILKTTESKLAVGLARETVFADTVYLDVAAGTTESNSFEVDIAYPNVPEDEAEANAFYNTFIFDVKEITPDGEISTVKAHFEKNVLEFNSQKITEMTVFKVIVSARFPKYEKLSSYTVKSFTIKVIDGVSVSNETELKKAAEQRIAIALTDNVFVTNPTRLDQVVTFYNSLYGNNKMISSKAEEIPNRGSRLLVWEGNIDVIVSNVIVRVNEVGDEITNAEGTEGLLGIGVYFDGLETAIVKDANNPRDEENPEKRRMKVRLEYSLIENNRQCVNIDSCDMTIEGCIMRNCLEVGMWLPTDIWDYGNGLVRYSDLVLKNCVMSNMLGTAFTFTYDRYSLYYDGDEIKTSEKYLQAMAEGKNSSVSIQGFLDVYNWQQLSVLSMIPTDGIGPNFDEITPYINSLLRNMLETDPFFASYRYTYNGVTHFHLGGMTTGLVEPSYLQFSNEDMRWRSFDTIDLGSTDSATGKIFGKLPYTRLWAYDNSIKDVYPGKTYVVSKLIGKLHGEETSR